MITTNDELVAAGHQIASDQDAADYLAALILALANKSEKVQYQVRKERLQASEPFQPYPERECEVKQML